MNTAESVPAPDASGNGSKTTWQLVLKRFAIWGMFLGALYLIRDFFFIAFMTFLYSFLTLKVVGWAMKRLSGDRDRPRLRRLLTLAVFLLVPALLLGLGFLVGPRLLEQGERLAAWLTNFNPESEISRVMEGFVGPSEFKQTYGGPNDERYKKGVEEFRKTGQRHVAAYQEFPQLEAWVEAGFDKKFLEAETGRIRHQLAKEGTSSKGFSDWFLTEKGPELQTQARKQTAEKGQPSAPLDPLVRAAISATPQQLLDEARKNPAALASLKKQWMQEALEGELANAKASPAYLEQFRSYYETQRARSAVSIPYTFDQYLELKRMRVQGPVAFGDTLEKMMPAADADAESRLRADFEAAKKHELFLEWWRTTSTAKFIRHQVETRLSGGDADHMDRVVSSLLNLPVDLATALMLSLFICIDFPRLRRAVGRLRETWLKDVYAEIAPALHDLHELIGRSMHAQGLIALCNAIMLFVGLTVVGVEHPVLLSGAVFVLCLVPTLGTVLAWLLIVVVALLQPGGGAVLALKASGVVLLVVLIENFVLGPRILGRMMELHPVLIIALLPLAQYFFGVWGLILATPVAVYVVHVLILRHGLPGNQSPTREPPDGIGPTAAPSTQSAEAAVGSQESVHSHRVLVGETDAKRTSDVVSHPMDL